MPQYIDKSALVAEINRLIKKNELYLDESASDEVRFQKTGAYSVLCDLRHFLNTLEVKEVDLQNYVKGRIDYPFIGYDFPNIYPNYKDLKFYCDKNGIKEEDKVKIIIMKEE